MSRLAWLACLVFLASFVVLHYLVCAGQRCRVHVAWPKIPDSLYSEHQTSGDSLGTAVRSYSLAALGRLHSAGKSRISPQLFAINNRAADSHDTWYGRNPDPTSNRARLRLPLDVRPASTALVTIPWVPPSPDDKRAFGNTPTVSRFAASKDVSGLPFIEDVSLDRPRINWYPGHIAWAEQQMADVLKAVHVVVEVRDARLPQSTSHPMMKTWVQGRRHIIVLNRIDQAPEAATAQWAEALKATGKTPILVNAAKGQGVDELKRAIIREGDHITERRKRRGLSPIPVRAAVVGYPNVGKSMLINRIVNRKKMKAENRPGVTQDFSWLVIDPTVHLMDSPGVIPARQVDQMSAYHLAMCDEISGATYDSRFVAAALFETLVNMNARWPSFARLETLQKRLGIDPDVPENGDEYVQQLADKNFQCDEDLAAKKFLKDFRDSNLGRFCIEVPP